MKLYRILPLAILGLLLVACTAQGVAQGVIDLPDNAEAGVTAVVAWLVSWVFIQLITLLPFLKFLDEFKTPLSMALAGQLIGLIENLVPAAYGDVTIKGIILVLSILALFGIGEKLRERRVRFFRPFR